MFCPNCGAVSQSAEVYCKRCGQWVPDLKSKRAKWGGETPEQHITIMLSLNGFSALAALSSAIILYATPSGGRMPWSVALTAALCVSITAWQISALLIALKLRRRLKRGRGDKETAQDLMERKRQPALDAADTSPFAGARIVTENTTKLLAPLAERAPDRKS